MSSGCWVTGYLLDTGIQVLIEATNNMFWGAGLNPPEVTTCTVENLPGENQLGRLWMEIRDLVMSGDIPAQFKEEKQPQQNIPRLRVNRGRILRQ